VTIIPRQESLEILKLIASGVNTAPALAAACGTDQLRITTMLQNLRRGHWIDCIDTQKRPGSRKPLSVYAVVKAFETDKGAVQLPSVLPWPPTVTAALAGDPLPGRSALDQRAALTDKEPTA
jgi:hypothetical protein